MELNSSSVWGFINQQTITILSFFKAALKIWENETAVLQVYTVLVTYLQTTSYFQQQPSYSKDFHPEGIALLGNNSSHTEAANCCLK